MKVYIKNKIFSITGKSYVNDINGNPIYNVKGRAFSPTKVKQICTLDGKTLYKVRNRYFNFFIHSSFIYDADKNRIAKVKDRFMSPGFDISLDGEETLFTVEGKWLSPQLNILKNGQTVGIIRRQWSTATDVLFRDSFELEANEADMPYMIALVIAIDNICDNRSK